MWPYCLIYVFIHLIISPLPEKKDDKCGHIVMDATSQMKIHFKVIIANIYIIYIYQIYKYICSTKALWGSYYNFPNFIIEETKINELNKLPMLHSESVMDPGFKLWLRIHALNQQSAPPDMNNRNSCLYALFIPVYFEDLGAFWRAQRTGKILQASINFSIKNEMSPPGKHAFTW